MTDILDLPGWTVLAKRLDGTEYELEAEYTVQPDACQKCGTIGRLYKHGTKTVTYRGMMFTGVPNMLWVFGYFRALAARRSKSGSSSAGDNARQVDGEATLQPAENDICHNVGYASGDDKSVIDQQVKPRARLKQSRKPPSDVDGDNI